MPEINLYFPFVCAAGAYIYTEILTDEGMILAWFARIINRTFLSHIFECPYCLAGQIALWAYIGLFWSTYDPVQHVSNIILSIFFTKIMTRYL